MKKFMKTSKSKERISLIKRRLKQGWTLTAIAEELERSISALSHYCTRYKIDHDRDLRIAYDDVKILKLIKKKKPLTFISEKVGIPYHRLYAHCKKRNFDFISKEGEGNLFRYDYSKVSALVKKRMTISEMSRELNISYSLLYDYCEYHKINVKKMKYRPRKTGANNGKREKVQK